MMMQVCYLRAGWVNGIACFAGNQDYLGVGKSSLLL
jgi:hypothetical protein